MAAGSPRSAASQARPGVGMTPASTTSTPSAVSPGHERGLDHRAGTARVAPEQEGTAPQILAAARPSARASSAVSSEPATPLIPSVPNRGAIGAQRFEY